MSRNNVFKVAHLRSESINYSKSQRERAVLIGKKEHCEVFAAREWLLMSILDLCG